MKLWISVPLMTALSLMMATPAAARRGIVAFEFNNYTIDKVADLPQIDQFSANGKHLDLGYAYRAWSIGHMPLWASTADGYVLYARTADGYSYVPLSPTLRAEMTNTLGRDPTVGHNFSLSDHLWGWAVLAGLTGVIVLVGRVSGRRAASAGHGTVGGAGRPGRGA